jgi:hypothetical protein
MSEYYLLNNPPAVSQGRSPRRSGVSGVIVFHTDEAPQQPGGALGTASFISRRRDYGCYHVIVDSTTAVRMLPPLSWETWGAASPPDTNTHAIHVAFRGQASRWGQNPAYDEAAIRIMGREVANILKMLHGDKAPQFVRWITRQDCINRVPGLVEHGTIQPSDRSDPWVGRADQTQLRNRISKAILDHLVKIPKPEGVDLKVNKPEMITIRKDGNPKNPSKGTWIFYKDTPWRLRVSTADDVNLWRFFGVPRKNVDEKFGNFLLRNTSEVKAG